MFHTTAEPAELQALTTFSERHGEERVSGLALKLSITQPNTVLDLFDPQLRAAFYRPNDVLSAQTDEPQADTPTPVLRFAALGGIRWTKQITGAVVEIAADDLLGESRVRVTEAVVDSFAFNMLEGGSVETTLRVKCKPDPEDVGALYERLRQTVLVTITPPEHATYEPAAAADDDQADMLDDDGDDIEGDDPDTIPVAAPAKKPKQKRPGGNRRKRAYPTALDGTGDTDPFAAPAGGPLQ